MRAARDHSTGKKTQPGPPCPRHLRSVDGQPGSTLGSGADHVPKASTAAASPHPVSATGVPVVQVRFGGIIHDFMMLNALRSSHAATAAIKLAQDTLREALK